MRPEQTLLPIPTCYKLFKPLLCAMPARDQQTEPFLRMAYGKANPNIVFNVSKMSQTTFLFQHHSFIIQAPLVFSPKQSHHKLLYRKLSITYLMQVLDNVSQVKMLENKHQVLKKFSSHTLIC